MITASMFFMCYHKLESWIVRVDLKNDIATEFKRLENSTFNIKLKYGFSPAGIALGDSWTSPLDFLVCIHAHRTKLLKFFLHF